jgi:CelD/BcsL family acetyltransferase involved in cellulose biosynthesis
VIRTPPVVTDVEAVAPAALDPVDRAAWLGLQQAHPALGSPFLSPDWAETLAALDGPDRRGARVAVLRRDGQAVGFLPTRVARFTAMPLGSPFCDYQGMVAAPDLLVDPKRIVQALGVSRLDLHNALADQAVFAPHFRNRDRSWVIDLSAGYDAFAADRRQAGVDILQDCAKKRRKIEREHGPLTFTPLCADRAAFDQLFAWKRTQLVATRQTDIFQTPWAKALMEATFAARGPGFGGALFTLHARDRLIAVQFALRGRDVLHAWMIAHESDFARYSPGLLLMAEILRWAPGAGYRELDLGPGPYRFKESLSNAPRLIAGGFVGLPSAAALVRAAEYRVCSVAEALPLGAASQLPGKVMRRLDLLRGLG